MIKHIQRLVALGMALAFTGVSIAATEVMTYESQQAMTIEQALARLKEGNKRFVDDTMLNRDYMEQVKQKAEAQYPFAVVISCLDSRVPVEVVFDTNLGDLFVGRIAGNFVTTEMLGSIEFATAVAGAKLVVVMGHTSCGAIKGVCDEVDMGLLSATLAQIKPSVENVKEQFAMRSSKNEDFVHAVTIDNVKRTVEDISTKSNVIQNMLMENKVKVIGAMYDVDTGIVEFLS